MNNNILLYNLYKEMLHNNVIISQKPLNEENIRKLIKKIYIEYLKIANEFKLGDLKQTFTNPENSHLTLKKKMSLYTLIDLLMTYSSKIKKIIIPEEKKSLEILLRASIISNHKKFITTLYTLHSKDILFYNTLDGKTSLQFACFLESEEIIRLLVQTKFYTSSYKSREYNNFNHIPYPLRKNLILRLSKIIQKYYPIKIYYKIENKTLLSIRNTLCHTKILPFHILDPYMIRKLDIIKDEILPSIYYSALNDNTKSLRIILLDLLPSISKKLKDIEEVIFYQDSSLNILNTYKVNKSVVTLLETRFKLLELELSSDTIFWKNTFFILKNSLIIYPIMTYNILSNRIRYYLLNEDNDEINVLYHFLQVMHSGIMTIINIIENVFLSSYQKDREYTNLIKTKSSKLFLYGAKKNITTIIQSPTSGIILARIMLIGFFFVIPTVSAILMLIYKFYFKNKIFRKNYTHFVDNIIDVIKIKPKTQDANSMLSNNQSLPVYLDEFTGSINTIHREINSYEKKILIEIQSLYEDSMIIFNPLKKDFGSRIINRKSSIKRSLLILTNKMLKLNIFQNTLPNKFINSPLLGIILRAAIIAGNTKIIRYIYKKNKNIILLPHIDKIQPLQFACFFGFNDSAKTLIKLAGHQIITAQNTELKTALHYAVLGNNIYILKFLLIKLSFLLDSISKLADVVFSKDIFNQRFTTMSNIKDSVAINIQYDLYQMDITDKKTRLLISKILKLSLTPLILLIHIKIWFVCILPTEQIVDNPDPSPSPSPSNSTATATATKGDYWILTYPIDILILLWTSIIIISYNLSTSFLKKNKLKHYLKYVDYLINKIVYHNNLTNKLSHKNLEYEEHNDISNTRIIPTFAKNDNLSLEILSIDSMSNTDDVDEHKFKSVHI